MTPGALLLTLGLLGLALAGCVNPESAPSTSPDLTDGHPDDPPTTGGNLEGTVTDPDIRPLAKIGVALAGTNHTTTTDEDGAFRFDNLEPKRYAATASAPGFETAVKEVLVQEGKTANVHLILNPVAAPEIQGEPVMDTREFAGLISCSIGLVLSTNPCQSECLDDFLGGLAPHICNPGDPNDASEIHFPIYENTKTLIIEVVLEPDPTGSQAIQMWIADCTEEAVIERNCIYWGGRDGESPFRWEFNASRSPERFNYTGEKAMRAEVWADGTLTPTLYIQHRFTLYVTTALYFEAPPDYSGIPEENA